jgi:hypothetical protein
MNEQQRQRQYIKGLELVVEAFNTLREPLDIDAQDSVLRSEAQIGFQLMQARDSLRELIVKRQRTGIRAAK